MRLDARPNLGKHTYAAGQMGVLTAKMAAARARELSVITSAFTVQNPRRTVVRMDAGPNLVKHSYAAGEMGVGTAKMAAKRAREVKVITCAFTVKNPGVAGRHAGKNRANVIAAQCDEKIW